ncbi:ABC transporter permease [Mycolicibacterium mengxianglii]|uniref:ABC transporter permease n=1 Tax=Mycolicibacterium mengxianglii TaxID=2736649 RepID=UPI0018D128F1|nr:ABC transporter permease subunit [Mycolicibacterium mengxianglii]
MTLGLLLAWQFVVGAFGVGSGSLPPPSAIVATLWDNRALWPGPVAVTATEALSGFAIAIAVAVGIAAVCVLLSWAERTVARIALAIYCLPLIAVAPLFNLILSGTGDKVALAALMAFFPILISVLAGLRSAPAVSLELVHVYGGNGLQKLRYVRANGALHGLVAGMKIGAPAAVLGALIGELIGAERGLGVLMLSSQHTLDIDRTYATAVVAAALAASGYLISAGIQRLLPVGFSAGDDMSSSAVQATATHRALAGGLVGIASTLLLLGLWWLAVHTVGVSPILMKDPLTLYDYLFVEARAASNRAVIAEQLWITLGHIGIGAAAGISATMVVATVFLLLPSAQKPLMSFAMVFQTVPTVTFVPLIAVTFGRNTLAVALMGVVAILFSSLIVVLTGLQSTSTKMIDVASAYGADRWKVFRLIRLPAAIPAIFAALRIAVPNAVIGALMAEWMITGNGLGHLMTTAESRLNYGAIWASVVVLTIVTALAYTVVSAAERLALAVYAPHAMAGAGH